MASHLEENGEDLDPMLGGRQSSVLQTLRAARYANAPAMRKRLWHDLSCACSDSFHLRLSCLCLCLFGDITQTGSLCVRYTDQ